MSQKANDQLRDAAMVASSEVQLDNRDAVSVIPKEAEDSNDEEKPTSIDRCSYAAMYTILFVAHWFGAHRFGDTANDEGFDPEDVEQFMKDPSIISKNFTRSSISSTARMSRRESQNSGDSSESSSSLGITPVPVSRSSSILAEVGHESDSSQTSAFFLNIEFQLDRNGDGQVDWRDLFENEVEGVEGGNAQGAEADVVEAFTSGQARPWFVVIQTILTFGCWCTLSLRTYVAEGKDLLTTRAGLVSIDAELYDLRATTDCEDLRWQIWRWWTYQWSHVGFNHVLMNTVLLLLFGIPLEGVHGSFRMSLMFNVGVFGGACCMFVSNVHRPVVGMSGGDYALMGMTMADLVMNWRFKKFRKPTLLIILLIAAVDISVYGARKEDLHSVSHSTHFGGCIAGGLIGLVLGYTYSWTKWHCGLQVTGFVIGAALMAFTLGWFFTTWPPRTLWESEEDAYCWHRAVYNHNSATSTWFCVTCADDSCIQSYTATEGHIEEVSVDWCMEHH